MEEKSTFVIIGMIISQIEQSNRNVNLAAFSEFELSQAVDRAGY